MVSWNITILVFLICVGVAVLLTISFMFMWSQSLAGGGREEQMTDPLRKNMVRGLSKLELESMPGVEEGANVQGTECAVCLDEIEEGQIARVMNECGHVFHKQCVDLWLAANAVCPVCRNQLMALGPLPPEPRVDLDVVWNFL